MSSVYCIGVRGAGDCEIYINDKLFRKARIEGCDEEPSVNFYEFFPEDMHLLRQGENRISVKAIPVRKKTHPVDFAVFSTEE